jgi:hypothetical protein
MGRGVGHDGSGHRDTYVHEEPSPCADCAYPVLHLYELVQAGQCTLKVRRDDQVDTTEGYGNFDVFFEVVAP